MSDVTKKLLALIAENKSLNEISNALQMSNKQLYNLFTVIKNKGIEFEKNYYVDGNIKYVEANGFCSNNNFSNSVHIYSDAKKNSFKAIVTSDLHIGNSCQRLDLLDKLYNYCVRESIHNIFICGDLIDGTYNSEPQIMTPDEQINFIIKKYPFDKNILNFVTLGDHDYSALLNANQNITTALQSYRHDIIPVGFELGQIGIKNDKFFLKHTFNPKYKNLSQYKILSQQIPIENSIVFNGHFHRGFSVKRYNDDSNIVINVPSLSDIHNNKCDSIPSAILMELLFKDFNISFIKLNQLLLNNEIISINTIELPVDSQKNRCNTKRP